MAVQSCTLSTIMPKNMGVKYYNTNIGPRNHGNISMTPESNQASQLTHNHYHPGLRLTSGARVYDVHGEVPNLLLDSPVERFEHRRRKALHCFPERLPKATHIFPRQDDGNKRLGAMATLASSHYRLALERRKVAMGFQKLQESQRSTVMPGSGQLRYEFLSVAS
eukprot:scpid83499/ scgid14376/ 